MFDVKSEVGEIRMILEYWEEEARDGRQGIVIFTNFALWIHHMMLKQLLIHPTSTLVSVAE